MAELRVPSIDFSTLGALDQVYRQAYQQSARDAALRGIDPNAAAANPQGLAALATRLLRAGDIQGAQALTSIYGNQEDRAFRRETSARDFDLRKQEIERAQRNADRGYGLQAAQFGFTKEQANRPEWHTIKDANGNEVPVTVDRMSGRVTPVSIPNVTGAQPNNPYATDGKMTGDQAKAATWADRMASAHGVITGLEKINQGAGGYIGGSLANAPMVRDSPLGNSMMSADRQKVIQAERNFVNSILRRESGAVISQPEFENAQRQYFPQPGDGPEVIAQKRQNRMEAIEGLMREAGRGYKPPINYLGSHSAKTSQAPQGQQAPQANDPLGIR